MANVARLRQFVQGMTEVIDQAKGEEPLILERGSERLGELVSHDDWLDPRFAEPNPDRYQQFLLYCDPYERLSVVSFVWGRGQQTPVHDHMVWGLIGVLRGAETCEEFDIGEIYPDVFDVRSFSVRNLPQRWAPWDCWRGFGRVGARRLVVGRSRWEGSRRCMWWSWRAVGW